MCFLPSSSISHIRSRHQGTDERLPTVRRAQASWCPSTSQPLVVYTSAVRLKTPDKCPACFPVFNKQQRGKIGLVSLLNCSISSSLLCCVHYQEKQPGFQTRRGQPPTPTPHIPPHRCCMCFSCIRWRRMLIQISMLVCIRV